MIKIDTFLTVSNSSNPLPFSHFGRSPPANFDTSSISRGLCRKPLARQMNIDHEKFNQASPRPVRKMDHESRFTGPPSISTLSLQSSASPHHQSRPIAVNRG